MQDHFHVHELRSGVAMVSVAVAVAQVWREYECAVKGVFYLLSAVFSIAKEQLAKQITFM